MARSERQARREFRSHPLKSPQSPPGNPSFGAPVGVPRAHFALTATPIKSRKPLSFNDFRKYAVRDSNPEPTD